MRILLAAGALAAAAVALVPACSPAPARPPSSDSAAGRARVRLTDTAAAAGLAYRWVVPGKRPLNILQTIGNGCALLDYDADGNLDALLVGSRVALFRGDGTGRFTDATSAAGLDGVRGHLLGCAVGDVDNDGFPDVYLSGYREGRLLHNVPTTGGRGFRDATRASGLKPLPWGTSCAFADVDNDGLLDLYVGCYAKFGPSEPQLCQELGKWTSCGPRYYTPLKGALYKGLGGLRFADITRTSGAHKVSGRTLGVAFADIDGSGRLALAIANDEIAGDLLVPVEPGLRWRNIGETSGTAYDRDGNVHGGMGTDWGDYDGDGRLDLFVATFKDEAKSLYHNEGSQLFTDQSIPTGVAAPTSPYVAFGCRFLDVDNDGWLDLLIANGHVQDNVQDIYPSVTYRQATQLLRNLGASPPVFEDLSRQSGPDLLKPIVGRGLASGDVDNDGRIDALVVDSEGAPLLLRNETSGGGAWAGVQLRGRRCRDAYGAMLVAEAGGRRLLRHCHADGSYMSSSDPRVLFGLGGARQIDRLTVRWPGGRTTVHQNLAAGRYHLIAEEG